MVIYSQPSKLSIETEKNASSSKYILSDEEPINIQTILNVF